MEENEKFSYIRRLNKIKIINSDNRERIKKHLTHKIHLIKNEFTNIRQVVISEVCGILYREMQAFLLDVIAKSKNIANRVEKINEFDIKINNEGI